MVYHHLGHYFFSKVPFKLVSIFQENCKEEMAVLWQRNVRSLEGLGKGQTEVKESFTEVWTFLAHQKEPSF